MARGAPGIRRRRLIVGSLVCAVSAVGMLPVLGSPAIANGSSAQVASASFADRTAARLISGWWPVQLAVWRDLLGQIHHVRIATRVTTRKLGPSRYRATMSLENARGSQTYLRATFLIRVPLVRDPTPQQIQQAGKLSNPIRPADAGARALIQFPPNVPFNGVVEVEAAVLGANRSSADAEIGIQPEWSYDQELVLRGRRPDYSLIEGERLVGAHQPLIDMTFSNSSQYVEQIIGRRGQVTRSQPVSFATARRLLPRGPELLLRWHWSGGPFSQLLGGAPDTVVILRGPSGVA